MPLMPPAAAPTVEARQPAATPLDPFARYIARLAPHPVPLIATHYDLAVTGALVRVAATRRFCNAEDRSIEATLTFPVPIGAVLHKLEADVGGRRLKAIAQPAKQARATYETALEAGKTAVLHEELLAGIHMLSVGHIAPGAEIVVTATYAMVAGHAAGRTALRIPLTAGDVYGRSGLPDSDELVHGGTAQPATVAARFDSEALLVNGTNFSRTSGSMTIGLDAPLDIEIVGPRFEVLNGAFRDGRSIAMRVEPSQARDTPIAAALLLDHSSSMAEQAAGAGPKASKHSAMLLGLSQAAAGLREGDSLDIWEFDQTVAQVGRAENAKQLRDLLPLLSPPSGGTEIGVALMAASAGGRRDVLLVTDGKSHALDVQALARTGCRFTVVLVGEDSLEANVGRLAALTGGAVFVAFGADIARAVEGAVASMRVAASEAGKAAETAYFRRSGMSIGLVVGKAGSAGSARDEEQQAVAALAAGLMMPALEEAAACDLAVLEGLVSHLTSLVLGDETATATDGIAATRKVALPSPRTMAAAPAPMLSSADNFRYPFIEQAVGGAMRMRSAKIVDQPTASPAPRAAADLFALATALPWGLRPQRLIEGDLSVLPREFVEPVRAASKQEWLVAKSKSLGIHPIALVLALMARSLGDRDRMAARIARSVLKSADSALLDEMAVRLKLPIGRKLAANK